MFIIPSFDPSSAILGNIKTQGINEGEQLMLYNDSPIGLILTFNDNSVDILPPYWNKDFISIGPMGDVKWEKYNQLIASGSYPISTVYGTLYEKQERVASVNASMQRGVAITNALNLTGGVVANTLINLNAASGTVVEEISSVTSIGDTTKVTSEGLYSLGVSIGTSVIKFLQSQTVDPIIKLGALGYLAEVLGDLKVDGAATFTGTVSANEGLLLPFVTQIGSGVSNDLLDWTATDTYLKANGTRSGMYFQDGLGHTMWTRNCETHGQVQIGPATFATITHGLGATPDMVLVTPNAGTNNQSSSFQTQAIGGTTFQIWNSANTTWFNWLAIKF